MAIAELLNLSDNIRELIIDRRSAAEIKRAAKAEGMRFLRESALQKVFARADHPARDQQGDLRRMNWQKLLTKPPPSTGWLVETGQVAGLRLDRRGRSQGVVSVIDDDLFEIGPVGLQAVDAQRLRESLTALQGHLEGGRRAAVVVPTGWMRTHLLEFDTLPRRSEEIDEVVRWRLKKLLPVRPADLRIAAVPHGARTAARRGLLVMAGLERAFADLERAFVGAGVVPGLVTARLYALAARPQPGLCHLMVQQELGFLSQLAVSAGVPRVVRTKQLGTDGSGRQALELEMRLGLSYLRDTLEITGPVRVEVVADDPEMEALLCDWWRRQGGSHEVVSPQASVLVDPAISERLGPGRVASLLGPLGGLAA